MLTMPMAAPLCAMQDKEKKRRIPEDNDKAFEGRGVSEEEGHRKDSTDAGDKVRLRDGAGENAGGGWTRHLDRQQVLMDLTAPQIVQLRGYVLRK